MPEPSMLRWVSAATATRFGRACDQVLAQWLQAWGLPAQERGEAQLVPVDAIARAEADPAWAPASVGAGLWLHGMAPLQAGLPAWMFGAAATASPLAARVATEAVAALHAVLAAQLGSRPMRPGDQAHPRAHAGLRWRLQLDTPEGARELELLAHIGWLDVNGWISRPAPPPLQPFAPEATFSHLPVSLQVELGRCEVPVGDLAQLAAGDVLLVSQSTVEPLTVHVDGTTLSLPAHLGCSGTRRAVQFSRPSSSSKTVSA